MYPKNDAIGAEQKKPKRNDCFEVMICILFGVKFELHVLSLIMALGLHYVFCFGVKFELHVLS